MTESPQQRRGREGAERKAATPPGPNLRPAAGLPASEHQPVAIEMRVSWYDNGGELEDHFWHASWGEAEADSVDLQNGRNIDALVEISTTAQGDDLAELVDDIAGSIRQEWPIHDVSIAWLIDPEAEVYDLAISLPNSV